MQYKYSMKKPYKLLFYLLLFAGFGLTLGRWLSVFTPSFVIINSEIHSHISNLSLSMITYLGIGHSWLLFGVKFRPIVILGLLLIAGNFICETIMGFMNTPDLIDAIYGSIGIIIVFIYLLMSNQYGLSPID